MSEHERFTAEEVAQKYRLSEKTLAMWRWRKVGPAYLKIGGRVLYEVIDIENFLNSRRHFTADQPAEVAGA